jgi:hypothetical protein
MALVYESPHYLADATSPGTHALVVGIGDYPFLMGGVNEAQGEQDFPLRQLTTAPASARAVRDWLLCQGPFAGKNNAGLRNNQAPLASVEVLISGDAGAGQPVDTPNGTRLKGAIEDWYARCNQHADNVAFLYVCGHGVTLSSLQLLASDFGQSNQPNIWSRALNLDNIRIGMRKCLARRQFMFFDCCRGYTANINGGNSEGIQIFDQLLASPDIRHYVAMYSTLEGSQAFGKVDQPSLFTTALLDALMGYGSTRVSGGWYVTNRMLEKAMHDIMRFDASVTVNMQLVEGNSAGDATLHELSTPPLVRTRVHCEPSLHMNDVTFDLSRPPDAFSHPGLNGPFNQDISPGEWRISMQHAQPHLSQEDIPVITPPAFEKIFRVQ